MRQAFAAIFVKIEQAVHGFTAVAQRIHYFGDIFRLGSHVTDVRWLNNDQWSAFAETVTTRSPDPHFVRKTAFFDFAFEGFGNCFRAVGAAAGSRTDRHPCLPGFALCGDLLSQFFKICGRF